jgi:hypothetical protein
MDKHTLFVIAVIIGTGLLGIMVKAGWDADETWRSDSASRPPEIVREQDEDAEA